MNDQPVQPQNSIFPNVSGNIPVDPNQPLIQNTAPQNLFVTQEIADTPITTDTNPISPPIESVHQAFPDGNGSVPPPPPVEMTTNSVSDSGLGGKKFNFKPLVIVLGLLLFVSLIGFAVFKFVLPRFTSSGITSQKETTLSWWGLWEDQATVGTIISDYQVSHPNVKINYSKQSQQDYRDRLTNALAKGSGPDIFSFHNSWVPMLKNDLDPLPKEVATLEQFEDSYYDVMTKDLEIGTDVYGLPRGYDGLALFVNEDLFQTAGVAIPKTWDETREVARALTIKDENGSISQAGIAMGRTENVDHWQEILALLMIQNGVNMADVNKCYGGGSESVPSLPSGQTCLGQDALAFFSIFSAVDGVWDQTLPPSTIAFSSGKTAMYIGPSWRVFEIKEQNPKLNFKVVAVPQLAKISPTDPDVTYASYWVDGVWTRSANKKQAWEFMKYLSSNETLQKLYTDSSRTRLFGRLYPKKDMASLVSADPIASAFINQAPTAKSWYLASRTFDGPTGINSQINKYFEDAVNAVNAGAQVADTLETVSKGVNQVLSKYGLVQATTQVQQ